MRVIFMGTPDFAVGTLEALCEAGHEVVLVVTQPDKPKGRGKNVQFSPVKECALAHGLEIFQPKRIREPENIPFLQKYNADVMVVAAFGQILPKEILDMTPYGCINVHGSLLPKYRGAAPIQWAVINGEEFAGVTIMQMDIGVDTGDMLTKREIRVAEAETVEMEQLRDFVREHEDENFLVLEPENYCEMIDTFLVDCQNVRYGLEVGLMQDASQYVEPRDISYVIVWDEGVEMDADTVLVERYESLGYLLYAIEGDWEYDN